MNDLYQQQYHSVQGREVPQDYKNITKEWLDPQKDDEILEMGSQSGDMLRFIRQYAPKTLGSDLNPESTKITDNVIEADATNLPLKDNQLDKSFSIHTIEHIPDLSAVFKELDRVTKPGGLTLHAFPSSLIRGVDGAYIDAWNMTKHPVKALKVARELHVHKLNPKKLAKFLEGTHWKIAKSKRLFVSKERGFSWVVLLQK